MIFYVVTRAHAFTIYELLTCCQKQLLGSIRPISYEQLFSQPSLPSGTYIFSDLERLNGDQLGRAAQIYQALYASGQKVQLLNHPLRAMRRYELLRTLFEQQINRFNVYRLTEGRWPQRYPVFVRGEDDHYGNLTPLLYSRSELEAALDRLVHEGHPKDNKIIIEFCDTADRWGIYRKYAAFVVGGRIIPRHMFVSRGWMIKRNTMGERSEQLWQEEEHYLSDNPHAKILSQICQIAHIDYGRIDYGILGGVPQIWEINTNPDTVRWQHYSPDGPRAAQFSYQFGEQLVEALRAIDVPEGPRVTMPAPLSEPGQRFVRREAAVSLVVEKLPLALRPQARQWLIQLTQTRYQLRNAKKPPITDSACSTSRVN